MVALVKALGQPYPLVLLALLFGLWRVGRALPPPRRRLWWLAAPLLVLVLLSLRPVAYLAVGSLEWQHDPLTKRPDDIDAVVVLGGYALPANAVRPEPESVPPTLGRCRAAARLYREGRCKVVVSGGRQGPDDPSPAVAVVMAADLERLGVARADLVVEDGSRDTDENAAATARILEEMGAKKVLLVTDAWHLPRAVACFRKRGVEVVPAGCGHEALSLEWSAALLVPSAEALEASSRAGREWLNLAYYRLRGRI